MQPLRGCMSASNPLEAVTSVQGPPAGVSPEEIMETMESRWWKVSMALWRL